MTIVTTRMQRKEATPAKQNSNHDDTMRGKQEEEKQAAQRWRNEKQLKGEENPARRPPTPVWPWKLVYFLLVFGFLCSTNRHGPTLRPASASIMRDVIGQLPAASARAGTSASRSMSRATHRSLSGIRSQSIAVDLQDDPCNNRHRTFPS